MLSDKTYLKIMYFYHMKKRLNFENVTTFNEKLQWLKLHDRKEIYTTMVDKYEVKKYVADLIGGEYVVPTYGIYESYNEIDFDVLPNQFVLKVTHYGGSRGVFIIKDKNTINYSNIENEIEKLLK